VSPNDRGLQIHELDPVGLSEPEIRDPNAFVSDTQEFCRDIIETQVTRDRVYRALKKDFLQETGLDLSWLQVSSSPKNFQNSKKFFNSIHRVVTMLLACIVKGKLNIKVGRNSDLWSIATYNVSEAQWIDAYIFNIFVGEKNSSSKRISEIESDLFDYLFDYLFVEKTCTERYLDMLEWRSKKWSSQEWFHTLIEESDRLSRYLIEIDPHYEKWVWSVELNSPINMPSHTVDHILNMLGEAESYIHYLDRELIFQDLKALELRRVIVDYLNDNIWGKAKNLQDSTLPLAAFAYLIKLLEKWKKEKRAIKENSIFSKMIWIEVSQNLVRKFMGSYLKKSVLDTREIPIPRIKKIVKIALLRADLFLLEEGHWIEQLALLIAAIEDETRIETLGTLLVNNSLDASLEHPEIFVLLRYGIENLEYVEKLNQSMILWIFYYFSDSEDEMRPNDNIWILHSITYEEFLILISISRDTVWDDTLETETHVMLKWDATTSVGIDEEFSSHRLSRALKSIDGCRDILEYEKITTEVSDQAEFIPQCFWDIHELIEFIVWKHAFKRPRNEILHDIASLNANQEYILLTNAHSAIFSEIPLEHKNKALEWMNRLYHALSSIDISEQLWVAQIVFTITKEKREEFLWYLWDNNNNVAYISSMWKDMLRRYIDYVIDNNYWSNLRLAHDFFIEEENIPLPLEEKRADFPYTMLSKDILSYFPTPLLQNQLTSIMQGMKDYMRKYFTNYCNANIDIIHSVFEDDPEEFHNKVALIWKVLTFFQVKGIQTFETPEKIFEFCLLWNLWVEEFDLVEQRFLKEDISHWGYQEFISKILRILKYNNIELMSEWLKSDSKATEYFKKRFWIEKNNTSLSQEIDTLITKILEIFHPEKTTSTTHKKAGKWTGSYTRHVRPIFHSLKKHPNETFENHLQRVQYVNWKSLLENTDITQNLLQRINASLPDYSIPFFQSLRNFHTQVINNFATVKQENLEYASKYWEEQVLPIIPQKI
jgi:hypothetical protein